MRCNTRSTHLSQMMLRTLLLLLIAATGAAKEIVVTFPDRGPAYPMGTVTMSQASAAGDLTITTRLSRMENSEAGNGWHGERNHTPPT